MKRMLSIVLAVCLMMAAAAPATAALSQGHLIQVMYEGDFDSSSGNEYYTDLGDWDALPQATKITAYQPSLTDYADITLAFFAWESDFDDNTFDTYHDVVVPTRFPYNGTGLVIDPPGTTTMTAAARVISFEATSGSFLEKADSNSYTNEMQLSEPGLYQRALTSAYAPGEQSLAELTGPNTHVDMFLYRYLFWEGGYGGENGYVNPEDGSLSAAPLLYASVRVGLDDDGLLYTEINPNPVPVPGAALLFGSGLLGFFGIRRKKS